MFMEKMASIVGPSYVLALFGGAFYGLTLGVPPKARRTTRILLNTYLNNVGKTSSRFANNTAAAVLLYVFTGKFSTKIDQLHLLGRVGGLQVERIGPERYLWRLRWCHLQEH